MALSQRLEFRQSQSLVMTPQLLQAIKLLQLSNLDLSAYVEAELEKNPLLEREEPEVPDDIPDAIASSSADPVEGDWLADDIAPTREAVEERLGTEIGNVFDDDMPRNEPLQPPRTDAADPFLSNWTSVGSGGASTDEDPDYERFLSADLSLHDHLERQLALSLTDARARIIGRNLIDLIDETGYFSGDVAEVAARLGASVSEVEALLKVIQGFEPSGVGARNLSECLKLQLVEKNRFDPAMEALLANLELLARRDHAALRKICNVEQDDLDEMIREVKALTPKPGLAFGSTPIQPVVPDVLLRAASDGSWIIELNAETLPRVLVNQSYYTRVSRVARSDKDKAFLAEALQSANWLTRSLEQRARTILKVASELVRHQDGFFALGVEHLRPLNLKTIADAIEMHESTVSRVTSNKYIGTSRGVFELKYFFTASIASSEGGEAHSAEAVRHRIKQLVDEEKANAILSDDQIVQRLKDSGIDIARRTVTKYREAMRIGSSVERRRMKRGT